MESRYNQPSPLRQGPLSSTFIDEETSKILNQLDPWYIQQCYNPMLNNHTHVEPIANLKNGTSFSIKNLIQRKSDRSMRLKTALTQFCVEME